MVADRPVGATYRLQLVPGVLGFEDAARLVPYLSSLGVTHLYCSPLLEAQPGSEHGYDVADPGRVRDELGGEEGLRALAAVAHAEGLGLIVDIVPNHVGVGPANPLWEALLREGPDGSAAGVFDVNWDPPLPDATGKVILPVLGAVFGEVLHAGELALVDSDGEPRLRYHGHSFPLSADSVHEVRAAGGPGAFDGEPGDAASWDALAGIIEAQHYRLVWWRTGGRLVNYRRFFAINELAAVRVEDPDVFARTHDKISALVAEGLVDGLRVDHPDGLRDPARYFARLSEATAGAWIVAEKILAPGERLRDWSVAGTTGYDFTNDVLGLFVDGKARPLLDEVDRAFGGGDRPYAALAAEAKRQAVDIELPGDTDRLAHLLWRVAQTDRTVRDVTFDQCREVIARTATALETYRTYVDPVAGDAEPDDRARVAAAVGAAADRLPDGSVATAPTFLYRFLERVLVGDAGRSPAHLDVVARFQQLSSALEAKGVEDTALYRHRRLLAVNEVGGDPDRLGSSTAEFHDRNVERAHRHPLGMLTTATHDTKRGEDVRLRIAALTELGPRWSAAAEAWRERNANWVTSTRDGRAPDPGTELMLYQTLVGVWPADGSAPDATIVRRVVDYAVKASREAKLRTSHTDPDASFEDGVAAFVEAVCDPDRSGPFIEDMGALVRHVAVIAWTSGLAQTLLRITSPGVPDTYQGTELPDDSLVDPDNRRPVDFAARSDLLARLDDAGATGVSVEPVDQKAKLWVLAQALRTRRAFPDAYGAGSGYVPLSVEGEHSEHVVAFARTMPGGGRGPVTIVPRLPGGVDQGRVPIGDVWGDTAVLVPDGLAGGWEDRVSGARHDGDHLTLVDVLKRLPVALLAPTDAARTR